METKEQTVKNTHHGHAVKRFRRTLGKKQEALAADMGISQALVSYYENKKVIEDDMVEKFAKALNVAPELIKELEEDPVTVIIENNSIENNHGRGYVAIDNSTNHYNPVEKIVELFEKLLEKEQAKIELLEKLLDDKKRG
ncbi:Helix-turn-helix [Porphyromonadaceae bacterium NLAE-zl-C104]|uniref:helix-turn-helix domain-containing protein n=1 Tax=Proteiniphilum TaxID=294702 RepID=UPI00089550C7|nr:MULTISPECIES: helix-turn-helix transcriptional regulator [Proteiniphilum]MDY9919214.1 helix-turn-helix transcriptional regulator [Proteiniphilum sp.]SEA50888.1 Helix-turn-helix [Porphyromonadaceae bacterium KH3R12]SFT06123.1 Helix-turn-helix [Porphyromonadaceae bacterium NLAE-zl-C104]